VPADLVQLRGQQKAPHPFILAPPGLLRSATEKPAAIKEPLLLAGEHSTSSYSAASLKRRLPGGVPVLRKASQMRPGEIRMSSSVVVPQNWTVDSDRTTVQK